MSFQVLTRRFNQKHCGNYNSYQLLTPGPPPCILQLSISHLWRVQVPRLPVEGAQNGRMKCNETKAKAHSLQLLFPVCFKHCYSIWHSFKCVHKYWSLCLTGSCRISATACVCVWGQWQMRSSADEDIFRGALPPGGSTHPDFSRRITDRIVMLRLGIHNCKGEASNKTLIGQSHCIDAIHVCITFFQFFLSTF